MDKKYDVVIIGAGIGGLVCGCYLAKAGLKVLICEQHFQVGGYCTSFKRKGFIFDAGVHSLGSLRKGGMLYKILTDLNLINDIKFITTTTIDRIIASNKTVFIRNDKNRTKKELISKFPKEEKGISKLFDFINGGDLLFIISKTKRINFKELLDHYITDVNLKTILSIPLTNIGLPASKASALVAVFLFREFIFDGGYYPRGGIQKLPNLLCSKFVKLGGEIKLSTEVKKIIVKNNKVLGVKLANNQVIYSNYIVSNADATLTFNRLIKSFTRERKIVRRLSTSSSAFVVYLGLKQKIDITPRHFNTWCLISGDFESCFKFSPKFKKLCNFNYFLCTFPSIIDPSLAPKNKDSIRLFAIAKYASKKTWDKYKNTFADLLIDKATSIIPNLRDLIEYIEIATPYTFYRYTSNHNGALFGWSALTKQVDCNIFPYQTTIDNFYLTGHWVMSGIGQSGIPVVALSGKHTAKKIINDIRRK